MNKAEKERLEQAIEKGLEAASGWSPQETFVAHVALRTVCAWLDLPGKQLEINALIKDFLAKDEAKEAETSNGQAG
ncbi:MAG: hypothetical protein AB9919_02135 [Geobacteraceae bacterium]